MACWHSIGLVESMVAGVVATEPMAAAMQTTIWVNKDLPGSDAGAGTENDPYATISRAVDGPCRPAPRPARRSRCG
jgi:hypothetical protein